jgi:hypothetical protein
VGNDNVWTAAIHRCFVGRPHAPARPFGIRISDFGLSSVRRSSEPPLSGWPAQSGAEARAPNAMATSHAKRRTSRSVWTAAIHRRFVGRPRAPARPFGIRISAFGLLSDFELRTSNFGLRTSNFGLRTSDLTPKPPFSGRAGPKRDGSRAGAGDGIGGSKSGVGESRRWCGQDALGNRNRHCPHFVLDVIIGCR